MANYHDLISFKNVLFFLTNSVGFRKFTQDLCHLSQNDKFMTFDAKNI